MPFFIIWFLEEYWPIIKLILFIVAIIMAIKFNKEFKDN